MRNFQSYPLTQFGQLDKITGVATVLATLGRIGQLFFMTSGLAGRDRSHNQASVIVKFRLKISICSRRLLFAAFTFAFKYQFAERASSLFLSVVRDIRYGLTTALAFVVVVVGTFGFWLSLLLWLGLLAFVAVSVHR